MIAVAVVALAVVFTIMHRWRQWLREQALDEVFVTPFDPVAFGVAAAHQTLEQCELPLSTFNFRTRRANEVEPPGRWHDDDVWAGPGIGWVSRQFADEMPTMIGAMFLRAYGHGTCRAMTPDPEGEAS